LRDVPPPQHPPLPFISVAAPKFVPPVGPSSLLVVRPFSLNFSYTSDPPSFSFFSSIFLVLTVVRYQPSLYPPSKRAVGDPPRRCATPCFFGILDFHLLYSCNSFLAVLAVPPAFTLLRAPPSGVVPIPLFDAIISFEIGVASPLRQIFFYSDFFLFVVSGVPAAINKWSLTSLFVSQAIIGALHLFPPHSNPLDLALL